jgi:hypothetical protein
VPRFQLLQKWQGRPTAPVVFYLFDLLWSDHEPLIVIDSREQDPLSFSSLQSERGTHTGNLSDLGICGLIKT